mgnify:CR=1 FL=1|tara:strand:+ start:297 stop:1604 length:1308 start_codon:yes stop_codon:yes gene_type:complete
MFLGVKFVVLLVYLFIGYKWNQKNNTSLALKLVFWIVLIRLMLSSLHEITYQSIAAGLSLISIFSIGFVAIALLYLTKIRYPYFWGRQFILVKILILVMLISGLLGSFVLAAVEVIKWIFLLCMMCLLIVAVKENKLLKLIRALCVAYSYPLILTFLSIVFMEVKASEADGSRSFIGGFNHESAFSIVVFTSFFLMLLYFEATMKSVFMKIGLLFLGLIILFLINYRTTVMAYMVFFGFYCFLVFLRSDIRGKLLSFIPIVVLFILSPLFVTSSLLERFEEIPQFIADITDLMVPYDYYYNQDRKYFSGRLYIWNVYFMGWYESSMLYQLIGHGPGSWRAFYTLYAHNTYISALYEIGVVGFSILISIFIITLLRLILLFNKPVVRIALPGMLGFIVLNMATMPLWQIEGVVLFSLLCVFSSRGVLTHESEWPAK